MAIQRKQTTASKRWPRYCLIAALVMVVIAAVLYFWAYFTVDSEFRGVSSYYGAHYEELFSLSTPDKDMKDEILRQGEEALSFIGSKEACAAFGILAPYCTDTESYEGASRVEYTLEHLAGKTDDEGSYLWVAYTQRVYDTDGNLLCASGSSEERILARWSVEKQDGHWVVTDILEHP